MTLRLLAVGDIHLGRRPGSVPKSVASAAGGIDELGPRAAWQRTIEAAIRHQVHAVVLLGDVVDDERRYYAGWTPLQEGCRRLADAGIEVLAIAGNHDVLVLPLLKRTLTNLRVVGEHGTWEEVTLRGGGARIVGWSYPRSDVRADPTDHPRLDELLRLPFAGPTVALLHGDLDRPKSAYAHFRRSRLENAGADIWLLGHIHKPSLTTGGPGPAPVGYLGSLTGLDSGETGVHGPWLLEFEDRRLRSALQLPLAPLRWERLPIDVTTWSSIDDLGPGITGALKAFAEREGTQLGDARAVGLRVELQGATRFLRELRTAIQDAEHELLCLSQEGRQYFVESLQDAARPARDLAGLARSQDLPGLLARRLLALEDVSPDLAANQERSRLLTEARRKHEELARSDAFRRLSAEKPEDAELLQALRSAGYAALEDLLATRDPGEDPA